MRRNAPEHPPWRLGSAPGKAVALAVAMVMSLALSTGAASAQGLGKHSFAGQVLTVQLSPITFDAAGYNAWHDAMAQAFHKATGATVRYVTSSQSSAQQFAQIEASHSGPDIIQGAANGAAYASGAFVHLSKKQWKVLGGTKQFYPEQLASSGPQGGPYDEVPMYNVPYTMVYNTALFKKAGIPHPPTTWTEWVEDAQKINDPSAGVYGTGFDPSDAQNGDTWKIAFYLSANYGGSLYNPHDRGPKPTFTTKPVEKAYEFWFDWYRKFHIVDPNSLSWQEPQLQAAFAAGKIGELPAVKSQYIPLYESGAIGHNFAFARMPSIPYGMNSLPKGATAPQSFLSQDGLYIGTYAPVDLALQFVKIELEKNIQVLMFTGTGNMPVTSAAGAVAEKSPQAQGLAPFFSALGSEEPEPFATSWTVAGTAINAMTQADASSLATTHQLSDKQIVQGLAKAQATVKNQG